MTHSVVAGLEQHLVSGAAAKADANVAAIKLCNQLDAEKRQPTHEEKLTLAKFTGWGGIWEVFKDVQGHRARAADGMILGAPGNNWQSRTRNQLRSLLTPDEFERAKGSILNAHYTAPDVIRGVYRAVQSLGFMGGSTLETSFGLGYWYGFQPEEMRRQSKWTAVELDPLPARIARYLYPEITLYAQGFETVAFPEGCFDAVFGNVPFGSYKVHDPDYNHMGLFIHNYFIARAIHHTRRGGIIALVTSTGTLDAVGNQRFREWMAERVELVGAVRLPDTAFKKSARTEVTTDVLFLQRRMEDVSLVELPIWLQTVGSGIFTEEEDELTINRYYRANPSHILGTLATGRLYTDKSLAVNGDDRNLEEAIAQVFEKVRPCYTPAAKPISFALIPPSLTGVKPGSFCEHEGAVYKHEGFTLTPVTEELPRIRAMLSLRRALEDLINIQIDTDDDAALVPHQEVLLDRYTDFVMTYGFINNHANNRVFAADPNFYALRALEVPDGNGWRRADIFTKRTARPFRQVPTDATPQDALVLCLDRFGRVDIDWIADRVGSNPEDIIVALGEAEQPSIFFDPADETWKSADDYLSGNVRKKLQLAQGAGLDRNVRALKAVLPLAVLPPGNPDVKARCAIAMGIPLSIMSEDEQARVLDNTIEVRLGANWIAPHYYEQFVRELFGLSLDEHPPTDGWSVKVTYIPSPVNEYFVKADDAVHRCVANTNTYGTPRRDAIDLINSAMNLKDPVVRDFHEDGSSTVNPEATEIARAKVGELKQAFKDWLWTDGDRAEHLTRLYNDKFNCNRDRVFGSANVSLPGSNPLVTLKSWQLSGAVSICQQKATLLGWCVGAGKTYAMIAGIMEAKRLGLVNKPMLCVLNGTEDQIAEDFRNLYPSANLLVADKDSFHRENRRRFISLIATNSWDCIILTHTQFFGLQMSQSSQTRFLEAEFNQLESYMAEYQNEENPDRTSLKQMLRVKNNLQTRIYKVTQSTRKDNVIDWEQLGVDMLALDEAHQFKNLGYITRQYNVAGLPNTHSQRAQDTFMKVRHVIDNGGRVVFATGTPVSNTMAELYTLQRYLDFDYLKELGLEHFDAWSAQFGDTVTAPEISPTGRYKVKTRFAHFVNLPELVAAVRRFASFLMADQLPGLQRPDVMQINVASPPSPELEEFMEVLARRADRVSNRQVDPSVDNMLKITTDGRKSALDMRLVDPDAGLYSDSKLHECAWNVWQIWKETSRTRAAQMVFCDLSTPKSKAFTAYRWLRDIWVALGVPADQIVFIHDYNTPRKRRLLTAQVRAGLVRIVLGSTQKLGTGVNMQTLLLCGHHIDCPWRPSDEEQRNGRFVRQGNLWKKVYIFRYVTEGKRAKDGKSAQAGFDSFMWQTLESKARFIYQILRGDVNQRKAEDVNEAVMNYAQVKALASGDPMILEKAELENEMRSLTLRLRAHDHEQTRIRVDLGLLQTRLDNLPKKLLPLEQDLQTAQENDTGSFELTIGKKVYTDQVKAGNALVKLCKKLMDEESFGRRLVGWFRGLRLGLIINRGTATGYLRAAGDNAEEEYTFLFDFNGGAGLIQNIINVVEQQLPERIASTQHALAESKQRFKELSQQSTKPFEQSDRLNWVKDRLLEIEKFLNAPEEAAVTDEALKAEAAQEIEVEVDIPDEETDTEALDDREEDDDEWLDEDSAAAYNEPPSWLIEALEARSVFPDWLQDIIAQANGFTPPDISEFATVEVDGRMIKSRPVQMEAPKAVAKKRGAKKPKAQVSQSTLF